MAGVYSRPHKDYSCNKFNKLFPSLIHFFTGIRDQKPINNLSLPFLSAKEKLKSLFQYFFQLIIEHWAPQITGNDLAVRIQ